MSSTLTRFDCSGILPVGTPKISVDNEEALHHRIVDAQLPWHVSTHAAVHDDTCQGVH
jgi:hypothetical protein